jgi:hypothetical protein
MSEAVWNGERGSANASWEAVQNESWDDEGLQRLASDGSKSELLNFCVNEVEGCYKAFKGVVASSLPLRICCLRVVTDSLLS